MNGIKARMLSTLPARVAVVAVLLVAVGEGVVAGTDDEERRRDVTNTLLAPENQPVVEELDTLEVGELRRLATSRLELAAAFQPTPSICGDDRDSIVPEYQVRGIRVPSCTELSSNVRSLHFTFGDYNYNGYHGWVWITSTLRRGMDQVRKVHGARLVMSSGYRCPDKNDDVGGLSDSLHQFGRAADIDVALSNLGETEIELLVRTMQNEHEELDIVVKRDKNYIHFEWE